jgi:O-antigen/teichoic acid export membrane protein
MPRQPLDRAAAAGVGMVLVGSMTANVASYLLAWLASRWLGPVGYGEFASLLAAQLVLAVPALALQTVVAREAVRGKSTDALRSLGYRCTAIVAVLAVALAPAMAWLLDTGIVASFSALVTAPMLVLLATEQGLLQGHGRFGTLSAVLAGAGVMKVLPAVIVLAFGGGAGAALVAGAAGTALLVAIVRVVDRTVSVSEDRAVRIGVVSVLAASQVQLALIALSSLDLLIVRVVLSEYDAGVYALGAVATKVAFWLPQAVGVVLYPKMANPAHSAQAVRSALAVLVGIGAVLVLGAAVAGPLVPMLVGLRPARCSAGGTPGCLAVRNRVRTHASGPSCVGGTGCGGDGHAGVGEDAGRADRRRGGGCVDDGLGGVRRRSAKCRPRPAGTSQRRQFSRRVNKSSK